MRRYLSPSAKGSFDEVFGIDVDVEVPSAFKPSEAQRIVRNFLATSSYRGLLLYHKLGAGKTCAAIGIAEAVSPSKYPRIVVVLAAALEPNFLEELSKCGSGRHNDRYEFVHFNGLTVSKVRQMETSDPPFFDNSVIIIDEVHNITKSTDSIINMALFKMIASAKNSKVVAMTGTPMVNDAAEIAYVLTLVRGFSRRYFLTYPWMSRLDLGKIDDYLSSQHACVVKHGFDTANNRIWMDLLPDGYRFEEPGNKRYIVERLEEDRDNLAILKQFNSKSIDTKLMAPMILDPKEFETTYVDEDTRGCKVDMEADFMRRARGFVSYYQPTLHGIYPDITSMQVVQFPMSDMQFDAYVLARTREMRIEQRARKSSQNKDSVSVYRTYSRRACNFCFTASVTKFLRPDMKVDDPGFNRYVEQLCEKLVSSGDLRLSAKLADASPKYHHIVRMLSQQKSDEYGTTLIYSAYRNVAEGLPALEVALRSNGYEKFDVSISAKTGAVSVEGVGAQKRYMLFDASKKNPSSREMIAIFNNDFEQVSPNIVAALKNVFPKLDNSRGRIIDVLMISESGSEGISLKNVRRVFVMEPYWQRVRTQQVIGRAVRAYSHHQLPEAFRNVEAYLLVSTFTDQQKESLPTSINKTDRGNTTDEHLVHLSLEKGKTIDSFARLLKKCAIDCTEDCFDP